MIPVHGEEQEREEVSEGEREGNGDGERLLSAMVCLGAGFGEEGFHVLRQGVGVG